MPLYDYDCAACGRRFEIIHGVHAEPPTACPLCGSGPIRKAVSAPAVHFKGSGWAKKERRATASKGSASDAKGDTESGDGKSGGDAPAAATAASDKGGSKDGSKRDSANEGSGAAASSATSSSD